MTTTPDPKAPGEIESAEDFADHVCGLGSGREFFELYKRLVAATKQRDTAIRAQARAEALNEAADFCQSRADERLEDGLTEEHFEAVAIASELRALAEKEWLQDRFAAALREAREQGERSGYERGVRDAREIAASQRLMPAGHRHTFADAREHDEIVNGVVEAIDRLLPARETEETTDGG